METVARTWPVHLQDLARQLGGPDRARARGEFWVLLSVALALRLRLLSGRYYGIDRDRIRDLASEKALDLMRKLDYGSWKPLESAPGEVVNFVSTIARNALIDELRRETRGGGGPSPDLDEVSAPEEVRVEAPQHRAERREFVDRLMECAGRLRPSDRSVWLLRVLADLPSKEIAMHPDVNLKPGHVDVILSRCRDQIRDCMGASGLEERVLPPGTYAELWERLRGPAARSEVVDA